MGILNDNTNNPHSITRIISKVNNSINLNDLYSKKEIDTVLLTKSNKGDTILRDGTHAMSGNLIMTSFKIVNLETPTANEDALHIKYVDNKITSLENIYLNKTYGGTVDGDIDMNNNEIRNIQFVP